MTRVRMRWVEIRQAHSPQARLTKAVGQASSGPRGPVMSQELDARVMSGLRTQTPDGGHDRHCEHDDGDHEADVKSTWLV